MGPRLKIEDLGSLFLTSTYNGSLPGWVGVGGDSAFGTPATSEATVRASDNEYGAVGGMRIDKGNRRTRKKPDPASLRPP
jgi:hypothetical protein